MNPMIMRFFVLAALAWAAITMQTRARGEESVAAPNAPAAAAAVAAQP